MDQYLIQLPKCIYMIKTYTLILICLFDRVNLSAQNIKMSFEKSGDRLHLLHYDTNSNKKYPSKSAVIEFKDFIVLLEMPFAYSNSNIYDHQNEGKELLNYLQTSFPRKPLRYVVSSHWHPHSISSITPFLTAGVKLISTKTNLAILKPIIDSIAYMKFNDNIILLEEDSMIISDRSNSLTLYKISKKDYPYLPTEEFIYTYNPKNKLLQTSCMYQTLGNAMVRGKEMISGRTENLYAFIQTKNLSVKKMLCTENFFDETDHMISYDTLEWLMKNGIGMLYLENQICKISEETFKDKKDSLIKAFVSDPIPISILNRSVYTVLKQKQYEKALSLAQIQALLNPSDPNIWDTLGEVYYFMGESAIALRYEKQCKKMNPQYKGGVEVWGNDLKNFYGE